MFGILGRLAFFLFISIVLARENSFHFTLAGGSFAYVARFGFYDGGTANLTASLDATTYPAILFGCTEYSWREIYLEFMANGLCGNDTAIVDGCFQHSFAGNDTLSFEIETNKHAVTYYFGVSSCSITATPCEIDYIFMNPNGEQLSSSYAPLPWVYLSCFLLWIPTCLLWTLNWIIHRELKNKLHRLITLFPFGKLLWCISGYFFWTIASSDAWFERQAVVIYEIFHAVSTGLMIAVFLLISLGWGMIEDEKSKWVFPITFACEVVFGSGLFVAYCLGGVFFMILPFAYMFIAGALFTFTNQSTIRLDNLQDFPHQNSVGEHLIVEDLLEKKKHQMKRFVFILVAFIVLRILNEISSDLILFQYVWLSHLVFEVEDWILFVAIGLLFRLRRTNVLYSLAGAGGDAKEPGPDYSTFPSWADFDRSSVQRPLELEEMQPGAGGL